MKVLILNWRDIKNPSSGGAEILTHEIAKGLVNRGHDVWQISALFNGAKKKEKIDGVVIERGGHPDARTLFHSVQYFAYKKYKEQFREKVDLVIDEIHGVPFFTSFYVKEKKLALICEVAGELWDIAVLPPFNFFGKFIEKIYPKFYQNLPILTISNSSKNELVKLGFKSSKIKILPMGTDSQIVSKPKKEKTPTLIFLSRISKSKGVEDAIKSIAILKNEFSDIALWIVGRGDDTYLKELAHLVIKLNIQKNIKFLGFVTEKEKSDLLQKAHILITPSTKEGWGLTVHEAGAKMTPVVSYNVPGLRDVVKNKISGIITSENTPESLAKTLKRVLENKIVYQKLQRGALNERNKHDWKNTIDYLLTII